MEEWRCYEAGAAMYASAGEDDPAWRRAYRFRFANLLPNRPSSPTIADAGCGVGTDLAAFAAMGLATIGIDGSAAMLHLAGGQSPNSTFLHQDLRQSWQPLVDGVWSMFALVHLPQSDLTLCLQAWRASVTKDAALMLGLVESEIVASRQVANWLDQSLPCVFHYHRCQDVQLLLEHVGFHVCNAEFSTPACYRGGIYDEFKLKAYVITARAE
jgi:SAM-dependent methyltransferase